MALGVINLGYNITRWHNLWVGEIKLVDRFLTSHCSLKNLHKIFLPNLYVHINVQNFAWMAQNFRWKVAVKFRWKAVAVGGTVAQKFRWMVADRTGTKFRLKGKFLAEGNVMFASVYECVKVCRCVRREQPCQLGNSEAFFVGANWQNCELRKFGKIYKKL